MTGSPSMMDVQHRPHHYKDTQLRLTPVQPTALVVASSGFPGAENGPQLHA